MIRKQLIGGPGVGKTHTLLQRIKRALQAGMRPDRIALVTFTRAGAMEAKTRACEQFGFLEKDLPYFRTLHSLCFREMGTSRSELMSPENVREFSGVVSEEMSGRADMDFAPSLIGDQLLALDQYARTARLPLRRAWENSGSDIDWYRLKRFSDAYAGYKKERYLMDFTDLLSKFQQEGLPIPVELAIVDEGQDLTELQWAVIDTAFGNVNELMVAGDDDQSIYQWSGAANSRFMSLPYEREILTVSHRLPKAIFNVSQRIIQRVRNRFAKNVTPGSRPGRVEWVSRPEELDFSKGTWLALARTRHQLEALAAFMRHQGVVFSLHGEPSVEPNDVRAIEAHEQLRKGWRIEGTEVVKVLRAAGVNRAVDELQTYTAKELKYDASPIWHDALVKIPVRQREYYLACRRRGEPLNTPPRVKLSTIHGAKGMEADQVMLATDMTYKIQKGFERDPDAEHRVFYVGATRAMNDLYIVPPQTVYGYAIT